MKNDSAVNRLIKELWEESVHSGTIKDIRERNKEAILTLRKCKTLGRTEIAEEISKIAGMEDIKSRAQRNVYQWYLV